MEKSLKELEERRRDIYAQMESVGDFRPGMISVNFRKCGKKNCACAQPDHKGHGPQYLWNTTQSGKSRAQNLRLGPELEKVEKEIANYKKFVRLYQEAVSVNEQICCLRPVQELGDRDELERLKKKLLRRFSRKRKKRWMV